MKLVTLLLFLKIVFADGDDCDDDQKDIDYKDLDYCDQIGFVDCGCSTVNGSLVCAYADPFPPYQMKGGFDCGQS
ncbi:hypothetical protein HDV06_006412 [Boothiomyces sp. JEL0866]|nr:hypothetical protein HDV06_006412 [Boothiomyces sp. JEL0866]